MGNFTTIFEGLLDKKEIMVVMVGLNAAGKTTILLNSKMGEIVPTSPIIGFNIETVFYKNISFNAWDVSSQVTDNIRMLWKHYLRNAEGIIFVVDSNDRERIGEAKEELKRLMGEDELRGAFLLVLANKQDLPNAMGKDEITDKLRLQDLSNPWYIQATTATVGDGLTEGLDWLSIQLKKKL